LFARAKDATMRILIIDDNDTFRMCLAQIVECARERTLGRHQIDRAAAETSAG
jgi:anthranilate/para-aminobenzoate synthase component II